MQAGSASAQLQPLQLQGLRQTWTGQECKLQGKARGEILPFNYL